MPGTEDPKQRGGQMPSDGKPTFQPEEKSGRLRFGDQFRAFRRGGLGLFDSLYNAVYVSVCERVAEKGRDLADSRLIRFLSALPRKTRSFFSVFTPSYWKRGKTTNHYHRKRDFLIAHLPHFAVIALTVFAFFFVYSRLDRPLVLSVQIGENRVGVVENEIEVRAAVSELEENAENVLGRDFRFPYSLRYVFIPKTSGIRISTKGELSDSLYSYITDYICTASGLYLDESLVAVAQDRATVESVLARLVEERQKAAGEGVEVGIFNEVQILDQAYPTSAILAEEDFYQYLQRISVPFEERDALPADAPAGESESVRPVFTNGALYADTQLAMTTVTRHRSNYPRSASSAHLAFYTTEDISYEVEIPYVTVYDERADRYTSMADVTTVGENGKERVEARLYWVDGKEARRDVLSTTVLREPVNEVISSGIKILPEDLGITGFQNRFIMPRIVAVSSGFGPRGDSFHRGWDLPGRKGDNIYAAASGTVVGVRYSEFDDAISEFPGRTYTGYGCFVLIRHDAHYMTMYAHCSKVSVRLWQEVKQGDKIGEIGDTGEAYGDHCHFEVIVDDVRVDPGNGYMYEGTATVYDKQS